MDICLSYYRNAHHFTLTMQARWFALLTLVTKLFAFRNEIVRDYFVHKNVPSVVAFLCLDETNHLDLTKILNEEGISVVILYQEFKFCIESVMRVKYPRFGVFLDLHCANWYSKFVLAESSKIGGYNDSYNWLLYGESLNESIRMIDDDTFSVSTDLVIAISATHNEFELYDVYNHGKKHGGKLNVTKLASWCNDTGLNVTLIQEKYQRRRNFHGMKVKVIAVTQYRPADEEIRDYLQDYTTRSADAMTKFTYAILLPIADMFNFTFSHFNRPTGWITISLFLKILHTEKKKILTKNWFQALAAIDYYILTAEHRMEIVETNFWDQVTDNGTHLGMIGMLYRNEGDLGSTPAIMTEERANLVQLIGPVWPFRTCFMFRSIRTKVNAEFIRPFTLESWVVTGLMFVICVTVLRLTLEKEFIKDRLDTWNEALLVVTSIICQQGSIFTPKYLSTRIVIMYLLLFSLLTYNYYSASVVSTRLNLPLEKMNDSLHELTKSDLEVGAEPITYTIYGLTVLKSWEVKEFYTKRWKPRDNATLYLSLEEGFAKVAKGGFAYHTDPNTGYPYVERLLTDEMICELTEVHLFKPQKMALWGRLNSPFNKISKIGWTKLVNAGILNRLIKRWSSKKPVCIPEAAMLQSISILATAPILMILCAGIVLASSICILENLTARHKISP